MIDAEFLSILARAAVYTGSVLSAGGVMVYISLYDWKVDLRPSVGRQILAGCALLILFEPLRYALFQLNIAGGDIGLAFGPDLRFMAFETAMGQAAFVRVFAAVVLFAFWERSLAISFLAALAMIGSFALEGHTVSHGPRLLAGSLLVVHLMVVHWWLGAFWPLVACSKTANHDAYAAMVERFGRIAVAVVPLLLVAGALLFAVLSDWRLDPSLDYQQRFLLKIAAVAGVLLLAARNKLWLTPLLKTIPASGAARLRVSIVFEAIMAAAAVFATACLVHATPSITQPQ